MSYFDPDLTWKRNQIPREAWLRKFSSALTSVEGDISKLKTRFLTTECEWRIEDGHFIRYMKCVHCLRWKERTTDNFSANFKDNIRKWFEESIAGYEILKNCNSTPCKKCFQIISWAPHLVNKYVQLRPPKNPDYENTPMGWFEYKWDIFEFCPITGLPKSFFRLGPNKENGISINSKVIDSSEGRKYSPKNHKNETTELCANFANVLQGEYIPVLDWKPLYLNLIYLIEKGFDKYEKAEYMLDEEEMMVEIVEKNWKRKPVENGVSASYTNEIILYRKEVKQCHMVKIVDNHVAGNRRDDKNRSRENPCTRKELRQIYFDLLIEQGFRCATSKMMMTIENGPYHFSFDRIDNSLGHIPGNLQVVCRILNPAHGGNMNFKRFLNIFLNQVVVEVPEGVREICESWYDG